MPELFLRAAVWIARQLFPPAGRHRQMPLLRQQLRTTPLFPAVLAAQLVPRWSVIRAEETAIVRPYVLAAERRRGSRRGPGLAATL
ncbi:hypothetical protein [Streptomyces sp. CA2R106]|uniref:hypothetical protein n=1 Tax=Streptomyces sp. CA2R106 TaxID=3120153 RepID=UPI003008F3EB